MEVAAKAGANAVKFQTFKAEGVVSAAAPKASYQLQTTNTAETQLEMLRSLELSEKAHVEIQTYCKELGLVFISTPFDTPSVDFLSEIGVQLFKIGSGELTSWPLLRHVAGKGKPIILSTGMSYLGEVDEAIRVIHEAGCNDLVVLHCVSDYPASPDDANLRAMKTMSASFDLPVGFSDHTTGIEVPLAAVALGASVIEKHFTVDRGLPGPDHRASLEPVELEKMVAGIRTVERALGNGTKEPRTSEMENRAVVRRSLATTQAVKKGTPLNATMLTTLRPGTGIAPKCLSDILGLKVGRDLAPGELLSWEDLR